MLEASAVHQHTSVVGTTVTETSENVLTLIEAFRKVKDTVTSPETLKESRLDPKNFTRVRKLPFQITVFVMLCLRKCKVKKQLEEFFKEDFQQNGLEKKMDLSEYMAQVASQQAFSQARAKFDETPFKKAFNALRDYEYGGTSFGLNTFRGHILGAIDGSEIALPDKQNLGEHFGCNGRKSESPTARASILYDTLNHRTMAAEIEPLSVDERTLARRHVFEIRGIHTPCPICHLFDRGYLSAGMLSLFHETDDKYVFRSRTKFSTKIDDLELGDHRIELKGENQEEIEVRVVKFIINSPKDGEVIETLVTNWFDLPFNEFKELYHLRWPVETNYSLLKEKLQLTAFTGYSVNTIIQDYWLAVLMSYIVGITFFEAQAMIDKNQKLKNKHKYQPNINGIVGTIQMYMKDILACRNDDLSKYVKCIIDSSARDKVVKSDPDRHFERKTPRKVRDHCNLKRNL